MKRFKFIISMIFTIALIATVNADVLKLKADQFQSRRGAVVEWKNDVLTLKIQDPEWDGGVKINPPNNEKFDFLNARYLSVDVENVSKDTQMRMTMHISSGSRDKSSSSHVDLPHRSVNTGIGLNPGEKRTMRIYLPHASLFTAPDGGKNMRVLDTSKINEIELKLQWPFESPRKYLVDCKVSNIRLEGEPDFARAVPRDKYFPFIDIYGQYKHIDWPEKIHSDKDLVEEHKRELAELADTSAPTTWNKYGGWANGPQLKATGSFRVEKYKGKWFFVDPDGRLFWSTGIDVLRDQTDAINGSKTPNWFEHAVPKNGVLPFTMWNLEKKYGKKDYKDDFFNVMIKRLSSWGINTIGCWGAGELMIKSQMPYTMTLGEFPEGFPRYKNSNLKFYDVFHPDFEVKMSNFLRDRAAVDPLTKKSLTDPMCIGYFIDNELRFGDIVSATFRAEADQPAKLELINDLKKKYRTIAKLNTAWKTQYGSWKDFATSKSVPSTNDYRDDTREFHKKFVFRYFEMCNKGIKSVAPHRLYLGTRFVGFRQADIFLEAAAKYCDVISVNTYCNTPANVNSDHYLDKPLIIGEFHFGTVDRGMFSPSLCPVWNQEERATQYTRFVQGALCHPNMVGAHWFQFRDQPLTGRWDGEGYQIGFVDVADTPYPELCKAAREVGENMYQYRINGKYVDNMK